MSRDLVGGSSEVLGAWFVSPCASCSSEQLSDDVNRHHQQHLKRAIPEAS